MLSHGLAYLEGEREISRLNAGASDLRDELERLLHRVMSLDAGYSVMKFRAYNLGETAKTLELNVTGLRGEHAFAHHRLALFRQDEERLRAEIAALREENQALRAELGAWRSEQVVMPTGRQRLIGHVIDWFRGRPPGLPPGQGPAAP